MPINQNLMSFIQTIRGQSNPQQAVMSILEQQPNNTVYSSIARLAKQGKTGDIENVVRNAMKEKGIDFDKEFNSFKKTLGL